MEKGEIIGHFLVEDVLRPLRQGSALLKVRYEGSYVSGCLCAVDAEQYGVSGHPSDLKSLIQVVQKASLTAQTITHTLPQLRLSRKVDILCPEHVSVYRRRDNGHMLLGFFSKSRHEAYASGMKGPIDMESLSAVAAVIDELHRYKFHHGGLHPGLICRKGTLTILGFPLFPVCTLDNENAWIYEVNQERREDDRRALALIAADILGKRQDDTAGFSRRLAAWETYVEAFPTAAEFVRGTSGLSCKAFIDQVISGELKRTEHLTNAKKSAVSPVLLVALCLVIYVLIFYIVNR